MFCLSLFLSSFLRLLGTYSGQNLYIAKGHSTAECRRFLKHRKEMPLERGSAAKRPTVCVTLRLQEFVPRNAGGSGFQ